MRFELGQRIDDFRRTLAHKIMPKSETPNNGLEHPVVTDQQRNYLIPSEALLRAQERLEEDLDDYNRRYPLAGPGDDPDMVIGASLPAVVRRGLISGVN